MQSPETGDHRHSTSLIAAALVFYTILAAVAFLWHWIASGNPYFIFHIHWERSRIATEAGLFLGAFLFNLLFGYFGPHFFTLLSRFQKSLHEIIGPLTGGALILLAVLSAVGEELLFRGALQPSLGFFPATLLFAASHYPLKKELWIWPLYALLMGSVLGALRILGGDIWSAVLLHFSVNAVSLRLISGTSHT